jgi:hypothetical protein
MFKLPTWAGRAILKDAHKDQLETNAALLEFEHGLHRKDAEEQAYSDYRKDIHHNAAAHHLRGMRAAWATGDTEAARLHGEAYDRHLRSLGLDSLEQIPPEVKTLAEGEDRKPHLKFKAHPSDKILFPEDP